MNLRSKYRIVTDRYLGFEVQKWRWWLPVWICIDCNTHGNLERAENFARRDVRRVVKVLGNI